MPFKSNNGGGPWGGSGGDHGDRGKSPWGGGGGGGGNQKGPDIDDLIRKGRERLRVVMGGKGGGPNGPGRRGGGGGGGGGFERLLPLAIPVVLIGVWASASLYSVKPEERSVELFLGSFSEIGQPGLNIAPWPLVTYEVLPVTHERVIELGQAAANSDNRAEQGLMLTGDENIVDIDFQVVWNISNPADFLFHLAEPEKTIKAVSEFAMRAIIAQSELKPILNRSRAQISQEVEELIQTTLNTYDSGVNIVRVNLLRADPPAQVIDSFRDVQAAEQDRVTLESRAQAYAAQQLAAARGNVAQTLQEAEAYNARVVNEAKGQASHFESVYSAYVEAPEVTRQRIYLETIEDVLGGVNKVIIDHDVSGGSGGTGVVPYLPLDQIRPRGSQSDSNGGKP